MDASALAGREAGRSSSPSQAIPPRAVLTVAGARVMHLASCGLPEGGEETDDDAVLSRIHSGYTEIQYW